MKRTILSVLCGLLVLSAIGCSTVKGMGEDVSTVGKWISKGSDNVQKDMKK